MPQELRVLCVALCATFVRANIGLGLLVQSHMTMEVLSQLERVITVRLRTLMRPLTSVR